MVGWWRCAVSALWPLRSDLWPLFRVSGWPGGDLLSRALRHSTMGAAGFHGRVQNGIGWGTRAMTTRPTRHPAHQPVRAGGRLLTGFGMGLLFPLGRGRSVERLGPVSCARRRACTSGLSTWWSTTALMARPGFEVGFPLRCFQRLSRPYLATRLCRWRDNRSTRGTSTPVLSY